MPDSYGKRQRSRVKARKANEREERRLARNQRRAERQGGSFDEPREGPAAEEPGAEGVGEAGSEERGEAPGTGDQATLD